MNQLRLLFGLYVRPSVAMGRLLDEGSPLAGALAVLVAAAIFDLAAFGRVGLWGPLETLIALAALYAPAVLFTGSLLAPIGGFGMAFRRDFGGLLTCVLFVWAAAHLPFALASLLVPFPAPLRLLGDLAFLLLLVPAASLSLGVSSGRSAIAVMGGLLGYLLTPFLYFFASPFLLFYAWMFLGGNLSDVQWSLNARRHQRRLLEAATLNPHDAEAHIQLGLIHLRRRQWGEARARFERAAEIDGADPDAQFQLGRLDRKEGQHAAAERHFIAVIAKDPHYSQHEIWREFGGNYLDAGAWEDARSALEKFVSQRPYDVEGLVLLGEALRALNRNDEAAARFRQAVEAADSAPSYRRHEVRPWRKRALRSLEGERLRR